METTIVLAVNEEYGDEQVLCWMENCARSGTSARVRVLSSRSIGILPQGSYEGLRHPIDELLDGPGKPSSIDLVAAQAYDVYGPCLVLRPDAVPIRSLDEIERFEGDFMLCEDPSMRRHAVFGFEFTAAVMLLRASVWGAFSGWWKMARKRVSTGPEDPRVDAFQPGNYGQLLLSHIFSEKHPAFAASEISGGSRDQAEAEMKKLTLERAPLLPRPWCWSRMWTPLESARVVWYHGAPGKSLRRGFQHAEGFGLT